MKNRKIHSNIKIHNEAYNLKRLLDDKGVKYKTYAFNQSYFWTNDDGELIFGSPFEHTNYNNCGNKVITLDELKSNLQIEL
jgi:hypothetical protein